MSGAELSEELVEEVTAGVLEEAAFVFVERSEIDWAPESEVVRAQVQFAGAQRGHLSIASSPDFAAVLAANLMGMEPGEGADEYAEDAIKELVNIVGGALLARWLGEDGDYEMGVPLSSRVEGEDQARAVENATCRVPLLGDDEYQIDVALCLEGA